MNLINMAGATTTPVRLPRYDMHRTIQVRISCGSFNSFVILLKEGGLPQKGGKELFATFDVLKV